MRRVRRLEDDGIVLGYHARISPEAVGRAFEVQVDIDLTDQQQATINRFEQALVAFDEVVEARRMFGTPDYQALIAVTDLPASERFMTQHLTALPGLGRLQSRFTMRTLKATYLTG